MKLWQSMIVGSRHIGLFISADGAGDRRADFGLSMSEKPVWLLPLLSLHSEWVTQSRSFLKTLSVIGDWRVVFRLLVLKRPMATDLPAMLIPKGRLAGIPV